MDKELWFVPGLCFFITIAGVMIGVMIGHNAGIEQALERVCYQTDGKYDFCQPTTITVKKYNVKIPEYKGK